MPDYAKSIEQYENNGQPLRLYRFSERSLIHEKEHDIVSLSEPAARVQLQEILAGKDVECMITESALATPKDLQNHVNRLSGDLEKELYYIERHESLAKNRGR